jgi:nucleotide-binding universal stress UspA family protein
VSVILKEANDSDLIVMASEGEQGIIDALRGSVTERHPWRLMPGAGCTH